MPTDLPSQIRVLVDSVEPVSADEAMTRAAASRAQARFVAPAAVRRRGRLVAIAASVVVLASAGVAVGVAAGSGGRPAHRLAGRAVPERVVLTAAQVRAITARSISASASSGTAQVTETTSQNGAAQSSDVTAVTFDGSNIDEKITVNPVPPGSAKRFTTDDRLVDGQFYIHTPGPGDVLEWMHDTDSANDIASMQFPDPRTLYRALDAAADFEVLGTTVSDGTTLTHLEALAPGAIDTTPLANLSQGPLTSFEMWVDPGDVVEQMAFTSSQTQQVCTFNTLGDLAAIKAQLKKDGTVAAAANEPDAIRLGDGAAEARVASSHTTAPALRIVSLKGVREAIRAAGVSSTCGPQTTTTSVSVVFANLGAPESVTAPSGAVDFAGKG